MKAKRQNFTLGFCLSLLGLTAWSAISSAVEPSPYCAGLVKSQVEDIENRTGAKPTKAAQENLTIKCSEVQLGVQLDELVGKSKQVAGSDKEAQCRVSVKFAKQNSYETSSRSEEELVSICMSLPNEHQVACGFPSAEKNEYFVFENKVCTAKAATKSLSVLAKNDGKRVVPAGDSDGQGGGSTLPSAQ